MQILDRWEVEPDSPDPVSCDICGRDTGEIAINSTYAGHFCDEHTEAVADSEDGPGEVWMHQHPTVNPGGRN